MERKVSMSLLPAHASLEYLKKQAKQLLAAQRRGEAQCCPFLRRLHRFAGSRDQEILNAKVTLAEAQFVVAMHLGYASWPKLVEDVRSRPAADANSLAAVVRRSTVEIPRYAGAGVPLAVVAALNYAGTEMDFMEFAAASGWAFSFGYRYEDVSPAFMAVRGNPESDGPTEVFAFLPKQLGLDYEMARTQVEHDKLWSFVKRHVDAGTPIMSEHMDGGLITAYRERGDRRQLFFDATVASGWIDVDKLQPYGVYSLVKRRDPTPRDQIRRLALKRAIAFGEANDWNGTPQGTAALRTYLADVRDETKQFSDAEEWFCWAAFERLMARRCCEVWLRSSAKALGGEARGLLLEAADHYGRAFEYYDRYLTEVGAGAPLLGLKERARTPERIAVIAEILERGIEAEVAGLAALKQAVALLPD
jgi:hypothetical protein